MGRRLLIGGLLVVLLAGCSSVPESGDPVAVSDESPDRRGGPQVAVNADLPQPAATPADTIRNYLSATRTTQNRPRLADTFIADGRPEFVDGKTLVVIRGDQPSIAAQRGDAAEGFMTGQLVGTVDANGVFTPAAANTPWRAPVQLRRVGEAWRFASAPPLAIREADIEAALSRVTVYFPAPVAVGGNTVLLPENRYLDSSVTGAAQATPIVRMLLAGPSPWLSGVARANLLPANTTLRSNVTVDTDGIDLDLSPEVESADKDAVNTFAAQVGITLRSRFLGPLRLQVLGRPIAVAGVKASQDFADWRTYDPVPDAPSPLYYLDRGAVTLLDPRPDTTEAEELPQFPAGPLKSQVVVAGMAPNLETVAAVRAEAGGRYRLWTGRSRGDVTATSLVGRSFGRPTFDRGQSLLIPVDGALWLVGPDRRPVRVATPGIGPVRAVRLAPDGIRIALVAGNRAWAGLLGGRPGAGYTVSRPIQLRPEGVSAVWDIGWYDLTTVAVAGRDSTGAGIAVPVPLNEHRAEPAGRRSPVRAGVVSLAVTPGAQQSPPIMLEVGGQLYWLYASDPVTPTGLTGGRAPFYPG